MRPVSDGSINHDQVDDPSAPFIPQRRDSLIPRDLSNILWMKAMKALPSTLWL